MGSAGKRLVEVSGVFDPFCGDLGGLPDQPVADHGLHGIEPGVEAQKGDLVPVLEAVVAKQAQLFIQSMVIGDHHPRIAPNIEVLERVQGKPGGPPPGPAPLGAGLGEDGLTGVLDDQKTVFPGDLRQCGHVHRVAGQMHRQDGLGAFGDASFDDSSSPPGVVFGRFPFCRV